MIELNEFIFCSERDCDNQIKKADDLYFIEDKKKGYRRGVCADCWMKQLRGQSISSNLKKTGGKEMSATAIIKEPVCEEPGCGLPIAAGTVFYFIPKKDGGRVICANCRMAKMEILSKEYNEKKNARNEAEEKLHQCTADLSGYACAQKRTA